MTPGLDNPKSAVRDSAPWLLGRMPVSHDGAGGGEALAGPGNRTGSPGTRPGYTGRRAQATPSGSGTRRAPRGGSPPERRPEAQAGPAGTGRARGVTDGTAQPAACTGNGQQPGAPGTAQTEAQTTSRTVQEELRKWLKFQDCEAVDRRFRSTQQRHQAQGRAAGIQGQSL